MRTLTTTTRTRRTLTRISALAVAATAAVALTACGGSSKKSSTTGGGTGGTGGTTGAPATTATPTPSPSFDPAAGPVMDAAQLPKTCSGLVTDADIQLAAGQPLNGSDFFQAFKPTAAKQTGRVKCQYGVVLDASGKITSDQIEVQLATYADADTAKSHAANTVGTLAGGGGQYAQVSVAGHPATYVTEAGKDSVLVMYDGNRTYLVTIQEALVKDDAAKALALKLGEALYKHTTPNAPAPGGSPSGGTATPGQSASGSGAPSSGAPSSGASTPTSAASS